MSPTCALCGDPDSPGHALFRCRVLVRERSALFERVMAERAERCVERALDDIKNGRLPSRRKEQRRFDASILSEHPDAVLGFVKSSPVWLDRFQSWRV